MIIKITYNTVRIIFELAPCALIAGEDILVELKNYSGRTFVYDHGDRKTVQFVCKEDCFAFAQWLTEKVSGSII